MKEITDECESFLSQNADSQHILEFLHKAVSLKLDNITSILSAKLHTLLRYHGEAEKILESKFFLQLSADLISQHFLKNNRCQLTEENLFAKCVEYCQLHASIGNKNKNKRDSLVASFEKTDEKDSMNGNNTDYNNISDWKAMMRSLFLNDIRFPLMRGDYFTDTVCDLNILTNDEILDVTFQMINQNYYHGSKKRCGNPKFNNRPRSREELAFTVVMSTKYFPKKINDNRLHKWINVDRAQGISTGLAHRQFIQAKFSKRATVREIQIRPFIHEKWDQTGINGNWIRYHDSSSNTWTDIAQITGVDCNNIKRVFTNVQTTGIRVSTGDTFGYVSLSGLRIYGYV